MLEHAILVNAGFMGEGVHPDDGFIGLHGDAGVVRHCAAEAGDVGGIDAGF